MTRRKIAFWSGFGLLVLLAGLLLTLWTADLGVLKPQIERWVSDATGREFAVDGSLRIDLGSQSVLVAEDIRFANADWADEADMLTVGSLEVRVDTWSLFRGPVRVDLVRIENTDLRLQQADTGQANWDIETASRPTAAEKSSDSVALDVLVRQAAIIDAHVVYSSPERVGPLDLQIDRFEQAHLPDDFLELSMQGRIGGRDVSAQGRAGSWSALLAQQDVEFELEAQLDTLSVTSHGRIDDLAAPRRPALTFSAQAPDINDLMRLLQLPADGIGTIDLQGSLAPQDDGPLVVDIQGNLGRMTIETNGALSDLQSLEQIDLKLLASAPDLGRILRIFGVTGVGEAPFMIALDARRLGPMVVVDKGRVSFADAEIDLKARLPNFPSPEDGSLRLNIAGPDFARLRNILQLPGRAAGAYSLAFEMDVTADGIEVAKLEVESELLRATGNARLGTAPEYFGTELDLVLSIDSLADLGGAYSVANLPDRAVEVRGAAAVLAEGVRTRGPVVVRSGAAVASIDGLITLRPDLTDTDLTATLQGPSLAALVREFAAVDAIPAQPYDLAARLRVEAAGYRVRELAGTIGSAAVEIDGLLSRKERFAGTSVDFRASGPALEELTAGISGFTVHPGRFDLAGALALSDESIRLERIKLSRERGEADLDLTLAVPLSDREASFDVRARGDDLSAFVGQPFGFKTNVAPFSIAARGELRGTRVSISGLDVSIGDATIAADGDLDFATSRRPATFRVKLNVPNLGRLGVLNGRRLREQSLSIEATAKGDAGLLTIDDLHSRIGDSDVRATVRVEKGDVPRIAVNAQSDSLVFTPFLEDAEFKYDPEPEFDDGRLLPNIALPLDRLRAVNADIRVSIADLKRGALHITGVEFASTLQDGVLNLENLGFNARSGWLRARGSLQPVNESARLGIDIVTRDFALGMPGVNEDLSGRANVDLSLSGTGLNLRQLAGNADGVVYVDIRGGRVEEIRSIRKLYGDMLNEILATINPFSQSDSVIDVECIVAPLEITGGQLDTRPDILVMTDKVRMLANAGINLASEELAIQVRTTPKKGLTLSAGEILNPYVRIVGTLAAPRLAVDQKGMLVSGGAAAATGGLSILAKAAWDRLSRSRNPCETAAQEAADALSQRFPVFTNLASD